MAELNEATVEASEGLITLRQLHAFKLLIVKDFS